jgi:hypothetical protein
MITQLPESFPDQRLGEHISEHLLRFQNRTVLKPSKFLSCMRKTVSKEKVSRVLFSSFYKK